jgi:hypothetical protein
LDRGIVPTWHLEVDPRAHKVDLLGAPDPRVEYLLASTCHPALFEHLATSRVQLWHVFNGTEDGLRRLPPGEWAIFGGCDVGLRAMVMAAFLGFRDLQVFGLDGCGRATSHAGTHPHAVTTYHPCVYDGVTYQTTPALLAAAQSIGHELDQLLGAQVTFHGEGLVQHLARNHRAAHPTPLMGAVAARRPELISAAYRSLNAQLHHANMAYGVGGGEHATVVKKIVTKLGAQSVLDYGCGKGYLAHALPFPIWEYDPAIPEKAQAPRPADVVVCTDVLEHVEPEKLPAVLGDLQRCIKQVGYLVIHTGPAAKTLPDGRNAHLIQQAAPVWETELRRWFQVTLLQTTGPWARFVVSPRQAAA